RPLTASRPEQPPRERPPARAEQPLQRQAEEHPALLARRTRRDHVEVRPRHPPRARAVVEHREALRIAEELLAPPPRERVGNRPHLVDLAGRRGPLALRPSEHVVVADERQAGRSEVDRAPALEQEAALRELVVVHRASLRGCAAIRPRATWRVIAAALPVGM